MQNIGIIPEAGSLAGTPSAKGGGGTAADGFLSLLASLNGGAGLLVDPLDVEAIGRALLRVAEDRPLRDELAERGRERAARLRARAPARPTARP